MMLTPTAWLSAVLALKRGRPFVLDDGDGPAVALVTWRTEYETSDYYLRWPRLEGTGLAIRNDAFGRLVRAAEGNVVFRDFVVGPLSLRS